MINGVIIVNKEENYTSHDVVAKLRGIVHQKKIGHTGTLDPMATGVLPVCLGKATKACEMLTNRGKQYQTIMQLGVTTDTEDMTGEILSTSEVNCTTEDVEQVLQKFRGDIMQIPPMYSALKVNGYKLCDLARQGITISRESRPITIYSLEIVTVDLPYVTMNISCSKGTYIRTLCKDIGEQLGCGGAMKQLIRTKAAGFCLESALTISEIKTNIEANKLEQYIISVDQLFEDWPKVSVAMSYNKALMNGNLLNYKFFPEGQTLKECKGEGYRVYNDQGEFVGLYQPNEFGLKPYKIFYDFN